MKENFDKCVASVLSYEGGYVNDPRDPGGATIYGVTKHNWESYVEHMVSDGTFRTLKIEDVIPLYKKKYWDVCKCDDLPSGIDFVVFDTSINSGCTKASKLLQQGLMLPIDGIIGPQTVEAAKKVDAKKLIAWYCAARLAYLQSLIREFSAFGRGWTARVDKLREAALSIA